MTAAPVFHPLEISEIESLTDDAVAVTFSVPDDLMDRFRFLPGQHVTLRAEIDGVDVRRSYSIACPPGQGRIRVGIRRVPRGAFSTFATTGLRPGLAIDVMPPAGEFVLPKETGGKHFAAIVAGSGITPVVSMISTALDADPTTRFTLMFGNRTSASVMFLEELEGMKDRWPDRFNLMHVLSREPHALDLFSGRIDRAKLATILGRLIDPEDVDEWYLCGPHGLIEDARDALLDAGVDPASVHDELFYAGDVPPPEVVREEDAQAGSVRLSFHYGGRRSTVGMEPDQTVLEAAMRVRSGMPFSCKGGMCATCKAVVVSGEVEMERNFALTAEELDAGYVLTCQAHPTSDRLEIDYDV